MSDQIELENVIEDAANDAAAPEPEATDSDVSFSETTEATDGIATTEEATTPESSQAPTPGSQDQPVEDDFAKRYGLQPNSVTGRENRIPYSRVKKIVERAEKEAIAKAKKETEGGFTPKFTELEAKVKDYEGRLNQVAQFENMIETRPREFLDLLSTLPAYKEFFAYINQLATQTAQPKQEEPYLDVSTMPQPDETLPDGSKVYSLAGLAKRDEWVARQVEARAIKAAEDRIAQRYKPIEERFQAEERRQAAIPAIQKQIAEARQWPHFTENEGEIVKLLQADPNLSIEGAYRQIMTTVVLPKLQTSRDEQRKAILEELKKTPKQTAAPSNAVKPSPEKKGPRSLEDIIKEAAEKLKQ